MSRVLVLDGPAEDIGQAREFYDAQQLGIGDYCADSLVTDIESLALYHGIHARYFGFHRMLARRFPSGIYHRETETETQGFAVLDLRRSPTWIRQELSERRG